MLSRHGAGGSPVGGAPGVTYQVLPPDGGSGIAVVGVGTLLRDGPGDIHLCATVFATFDMPSSHAGCGPVAVRTTGVAGSWLTTQTTGGQAYSRRVRVVGVYHLGTLAVTSVAEASTDPTPLPANPPVPCPAPSGGWRPGTGFASSTDQMDPERRLSDYVAQRPDIFGASWVGYPANVPVGASAPTVSVRIIGTTGDLAQAHTELSAIYAGNLCVYRVERSKTDLQRIVDTLTSRSATPVEATPLETENRVQVTVVALDGPMDTLLTQIGRDAVQLEPPLLRAP